MKIGKAKEYFQLNIVNGAVVKKVQNEWEIELGIGKILDIERRIETARNEIKRYKSLDSALNDLALIGIKEFMVVSE